MIHKTKHLLSEPLTWQTLTVSLIVAAIYLNFWKRRRGDEIPRYPPMQVLLNPTHASCNCSEMQTRHNLDYQENQSLGHHGWSEPGQWYWKAPAGGSAVKSSAKNLMIQRGVEIPALMAQMPLWLSQRYHKSATHPAPPACLQLCQAFVAQVQHLHPNISNQSSYVAPVLWRYASETGPQGQKSLQTLSSNDSRSSAQCHATAHLSWQPLWRCAPALVATCLSTAQSSPKKKSSWATYDVTNHQLPLVPPWMHLEAGSVSHQLVKSSSQAWSSATHLCPTGRAAKAGTAGPKDRKLANPTE